MEGHELLNRLARVKAPDAFEEGVFRKVGEARKARARRRAAFRYAFAGSAAVLVVGFMILNQRSVKSQAPLSYASRAKAEAASPVRNAAYPVSSLRNASSSYLPVLETVNYSSEMRNASPQPRTVYILEQVSEVRPSEIKY